jgi:hypothetical protein
MVVNGFALPTTLVQLCEAMRRGEAPDVWELKKTWMPMGILGG